MKVIFVFLITVGLMGCGGRDGKKLDSASSRVASSSNAGGVVTSSYKMEQHQPDQCPEIEGTYTCQRKNGRVDQNTFSRNSNGELEITTIFKRPLVIDGLHQENSKSGWVQETWCQEGKIFLSSEIGLFGQRVEGIYEVTSKGLLEQTRVYQTQKDGKSLKLVQESTCTYKKKSKD